MKANSKTHIHVHVHIHRCIVNIYVLDKKTCVLFLYTNSVDIVTKQLHVHV